MPYQILNSAVVKCRFKSSCPGSPHTFSMSGFLTVRFNRLQYENLRFYEKPFFQPTHLKLMCKQDNSQTLRRPPTCLCLQFSYNWTTVVQNEQNYPSCCLSLGVLMKGFLQWLVGWYAAAAAHAQWADDGMSFAFWSGSLKRGTAFKGRPCMNVKRSLLCTSLHTPAVVSSGSHVQYGISMSATSPNSCPQSFV